MKGQVSRKVIVGLPSQTVPISAGSAKRYEGCCPDGRWHSSNWPFPDTFHQLLPIISPTRNSTCVNSMSDFVEGACNTQYASNATKYTASPSLDADGPLDWLKAVPYCFLQDIFHSTLLQTIHFDCDFSFKKKKDHFFFFVWAENHRWKKAVH